MQTTLVELWNSVTVVNKTTYDYINNLCFIVQAAVVRALTALLFGIPLLHL
jgi:hypothetical protein